MKYFVEIQHSVLWKLCFENYGNYIGIREKQFSKKQLIFWLVETVFLGQSISLVVETIIGIRRKQFWEKDLILAGGQLIFRLVETIFLFHYSETPVSFFSI